MTWVRIDDTLPEDARWESAGVEALALHVAALAYCNRALTDGVVSRSRALRLLPLADADAVIEALVAAGFWHHRDDDDLELVGYLDVQPSSDKVQRMRADSAERQERSRRHRVGDHSSCIRGRYCPDGAVTRDSRRESQRDSQRPTRPDPTLREGEGLAGSPARLTPPAHRPKVRMDLGGLS